ncbi:hypothetical protein HDU85_006386 [Gaertneriomyces sp. JEL0708]|nr:hypothetical protein HDU85_006386 [Gaertneriomyces sp. JEL0708]
MQTFSKWSMTWKKENPGYEYRLWTDDDNRRMIAQHYPWALAAYDGMPKNIQRADMARYFYMHRYGGVYADLDMQCLRPMDELLACYGPCRDCIKNTAFLALMGSSLEWEHSLPNAWMASTPGHSFWMHVAHKVLDKYAAWKRGEGEGPEWMTGPIALRETYLRYMANYPPGSEADPVVLLEPSVIYPLDWSRFGEIGWACSPKSNTFNENRCHELIDMQHSYAVTYWSHTWD